MTRREFCAGALAAAISAAIPSRSFSGGTKGPVEKALPFSREWLQGRAQSLAARPYAAPNENLPAWVPFDWDVYQAIRFRPEKALWRSQGLPFQVRFFHLGLYYKRAVALYEVADGVARPIRFSPDLFQFPSGLDPTPSADLGFAGFRIHPKDDFDPDEASFLGASYFRATGKEKQYGLSARGLAIDTGLPQPEEFPDFREFWLERPGPESESLTVHALLDSRSTTGAYTFVIRCGEWTVMDVDARLYPRREIVHAGIAPLTSMFQHGENDRRTSDDYRPEIHDSDGLAMCTGAGEWIWRPLTNPPVLRVNSFLDENPRGFGLLQRDHDFNNYQDDGAYYNRRPSLWVEPLEGWGKGAVQLVEIPTDDEIFDNIVAFWNPERPLPPGKEIHFRYRLHWGAAAPARPGGAEVIATRLGKAGVLGKRETVPGRKFVVDFRGGKLAGLGKEDFVEPVISASRGKIVISETRSVRPVKDLQGWRCSFDLVYDGKDPVDLRLYLRDRQGALTETWLYQWVPVPK